MASCLAKNSIPPQHMCSDHLICPKYLSVVLVQRTGKWHVLLHTQVFCGCHYRQQSHMVFKGMRTATSTFSLGLSKSHHHWGDKGFASFSILSHCQISATSPFTGTWEWIFAISQMPPPLGWNAVVISTQNHLCQIPKKNAVSSWIWKSVGSTL